MCNNIMPNMMIPNMINEIPLMNNYANGMPFNNMNYNIENNDINTRLNAIERQIRRMQERISKLEAINNNSNYNEIDNSMYMM